MVPSLFFGQVGRHEFLSKCEFVLESHPDVTIFHAVQGLGLLLVCLDSRNVGFNFFIQNSAALIKI